MDVSPRSPVFTQWWIFKLPLQSSVMLVLSVCQFLSLFLTSVASWSYLKTRLQIPNVLRKKKNVESTRQSGGASYLPQRGLRQSPGVKQKRFWCILAPGNPICNYQNNYSTHALSRSHWPLVHNIHSKRNSTLILISFARGHQWHTLSQQRDNRPRCRLRCGLQWSKKPCSRWGPDHPREGSLLGS